MANSFGTAVYFSKITVCYETPCNNFWSKSFLARIYNKLRLFQKKICSFNVGSYLEANMSKVEVMTKKFYFSNISNYTLFNIYSS